MLYFCRSCEKRGTHTNENILYFFLSHESVVPRTCISGPYSATPSGSHTALFRKPLAEDTRC